MGLMRRSILVALAGAALLAAPAAASGGRGHGGGGLQKIRHFVVIYEENHSFDNLYGGWERVDGLDDADPAHTTQVSQAGTPYQCLLQNDVNLTSPPLTPDCTNTAPASHFSNAPFQIDDYIAPEDTTCPAPGVFAPNGVPKGSGLPGGCTRDLVHRFYQEQYQLDGGKQDRYVTGSDAVGLTMGTYDTRALPIYEYLHGRHHPDYAISDRFFQASFGGSFLNHQWLVAAASPTFYGAVTDGGAERPPFPGRRERDAEHVSALHADRNGQGRRAHRAVRLAASRAGWRAATSRSTRSSRRTSPTRRGPRSRGGCRRRLGATIGDRLSQKGVDWAWYSGGWSNANGDVGGTGVDERHGADLRRHGQHGDERRVPELPGQALPVPPPAAQLLRVIRPRHVGAATAPA